MQLHYTVFLDYCVEGPTDADNVWYRKVIGLPFVPVEGRALRITGEDGSTFDYTPEQVRYDVEGRRFEAEYWNELPRDYFTSGNGVGWKALAAEYVLELERAGFARLNFPTGVGRE